jgi:CheY-like chemotaxis protein
MKPGVRVLVVDDDEDIRELLALLLEANGAVVAVAADGVDALEALDGDGHTPALILLDLMMPRMDGQEFLTRLRAGPYRDVPVVLISGHLGSASKAKELGADGWLGKPLHYDELLSVVDRFVA